MRNERFDVRLVAAVTLWLIILFLGGVLAGEAVMGATITAPVTITTSVNLSLSNSTATLTVPGSITTYALSNVTTSYVVPVSFSENVSLFNVTVALNESQGCFAFLNETVTNQTAYLENLIRSQLVPSQNQYEEQRQKLTDQGVQCENEKNILRNQVTSEIIQHNSTRTSYESIVQRQGGEIVKLQGEKKTYYFLNLVLIGVVVLMLVGFAKNFTLKTMWDSFANMRGSRPSVGYSPPPPQQEVKK